MSMSEPLPELNGGFKLIGRIKGRKQSRPSLNLSSPEVRPSMRITKGYILLHKLVWEELGSPSRLQVALNTATAEVRFLAEDTHPGMVSYQVSLRPRSGTSIEYRLRLSRIQNQLALVRAMPLGYYVSIGGGTFRYHGPKPPLK